MKKLLLSFLITLMALPALLPWMPHGTVHALHDQHGSHHESRSHSGEVHGHDSGHQANGYTEHAQRSVHHAIDLDIVTYFNDYLHVDLQNPDQVAFNTSSQDMQDFDFDLATGFLSEHRYELASIQNRAPPDWQRTTLNHTPIYLSTQRLRI